MRLLVYEPSWRRIAGSISHLGIEPVLMSDTGVLTFEGRPIAIEDAGVEAAWASMDAFFGPKARDYSIAMLKAPALRWVQTASAGYDDAIFSRLVGKGVRLTTSHGHAVGISEYVVWGVLDQFKHGPQRRAAQAARDWRRMRVREVMGTRWLVVGFGAIGAGVGRIARALGAHVTGVRRSQRDDPDADAIAAMSDLPGLLPDADVVVLTCPLTPETRNLVDAGFLGRMKAGSVLVNVGRGQLVDEAALLAALDRGVPEHAVLDVFDTEPLPADSRFWDHPRVFLTPHNSGVTDGQAARIDAAFVENLGRYVRGEPLLHEEDPGDVLAGQG